MLDELHGKPSQTQTQQLLEHYATGTPTLFKQFDGFSLGENYDSVMYADKDGHCVMHSEEYELRHSDHLIRLQIRTGTPAAIAVALVQKILNDVKTIAKKDGDKGFNLREFEFPGCAMDDSGEVPF